MSTCCERETGLRHELKVARDLIARAAVDHRLRRIFTEDQHANIANTYTAFIARIDTLLDSKSEAA